MSSTQRTSLASGLRSFALGPAVAGPSSISPDSIVDEEPSTSSDPPSKRARTGAPRTTSASFNRKRALVACQLCRARKVKCNNGRPACGSCVLSESTCVYDDAHDLSTFDPASISILDRLSQVLSRLDQLPNAIFNFEHAATTRMNLHQNDDASEKTTTAELLPQPLPQSDFDDMRIPAQRTSPDAILAWPVLESLFPPNHLIKAVFEAELATETLENQEGSNPYHTRGSEAPYRGLIYGVNEDEVPDLVRQFLTFVHTKNPILDVELLGVYVDRLVETGLTWDPASCLVLLVCALGCLARPYVVDGPSTPSTPRPHMSTSLESDGESMRKASAYYKLACRRFGLLENGILAPQCYFLAGVYSMYTMAPLKAWSHFQSASRACRLHLMCEAYRQGEDGTPASLKRESLEQRIFWSCYKSECELRVEINVPNSSLADLEYPVLYPKPPENLTPHGSDGNSTSVRDPANSSSNRRAFEHEEQSWYYYLTDITLRRLGNRICNALYADDHRSWSDENIPFLLKAVGEFETKFDEWYSALPHVISFNHDEMASGELNYLIQSRTVEIKAWLYRPFLYYAIHNAADAFYRGAVQHLVDKALFFHMGQLRLGSTRHRTHRTWYGLRESTAACLIFIAAARCGTIVMPSDWEKDVSACIERMRYWKDEVPTVERSIQTLEECL